MTEGADVLPETVASVPRKIGNDIGASLWGTKAESHRGARYHGRRRCQPTIEIGGVQTMRDEANAFEQRKPVALRRAGLPPRDAQGRIDSWRHRHRDADPAATTIDQYE